jgi:hypothetical protein
MNTDHRSKPPSDTATEPVAGAPGTASRRTAASRAREFLSARLATREGSIGVFRAHGTHFQTSGFDPKSR